MNHGTACSKEYLYAFSEKNTQQNFNPAQNRVRKGRVREIHRKRRVDIINPAPAAHCRIQVRQYRMPMSGFGLCQADEQTGAFEPARRSKCRIRAHAGVSITSAMRNASKIRHWPESRTIKARPDACPKTLFWTDFAWPALYYRSKVVSYQSGNLRTDRCFSATIVMSGSIVRIIFEFEF